MLADLGWNMTCTDIDAATLNVCRSKLPQATCILTRPQDTRLPCTSASVALLLCIEVAPVIQTSWFASEAARCLADEGILVGVFWNRASLRGAAVALKERLQRRNTPFYKQTYRAFRRSLLDNGFALLHEEGFCWGPFGRASNSPLIPGFIALETGLRLDRLPVVSPWIAFIARKTSR
jgi:hypothetical protein